MPRTGRPKALLELSSEEREQLERWATRRKSSQALALRSRIVLGCAEGLPNKEVAAREGVAQQTVGKWRARFLDLRLDGLGDDPRPGRVPSVTADQVEKIVVDTLESTPENATHWSRTSMAKKSGLSPSTIGRIWHAFELKPHDNYGTHKTPAIRKWLAAHPRFHMHFTPTYSSWINQVERWFAYITDQLIRRGDHRSVQALEADIRAWVKAWN